MYEDRFRRRRAHAFQELRTRGVIGDRVPWSLRLFVRLFPRAIPPYYGGHGPYGAMMGGLFGLPLALALAGLFTLNGMLPPLAGLAIGVLAGALFGAFMTVQAKSVHAARRLSRWQDLDFAPRGGTVETQPWLAAGEGAGAMGRLVGTPGE